MNKRDQFHARMVEQIDIFNTQTSSVHYEITELVLKAWDTGDLEVRRDHMNPTLMTGEIYFYNFLKKNGYDI